MCDVLVIGWSIVCFCGFSSVDVLSDVLIRFAICAVELNYFQFKFVSSSKYFDFVEKPRILFLH